LFVQLFVPEWSVQPPRPTQTPTVIGYEMSIGQRADEALWLGSKDRYGSFHLSINVWVTGKTVIPGYHMPYLSTLEMSSS